MAWPSRLLIAMIRSGGSPPRRRGCVRCRKERSFSADLAGTPRDPVVGAPAGPNDRVRGGRGRRTSLPVRGRPLHDLVELCLHAPIGRGRAPIAVLEVLVDLGANELGRER